MKREITTHSLEETQSLTKDWLLSIEPNTDSATVVGLYGNLGAGKTAFTQAVARELGVKEIVTSPTFVIEKIYEANHPKFKRLIHIDAYRLTSGSELQALKFEEIVGNKNNLVIIEWPENIKEAMPEDHLKIYCEFVSKGVRRFVFE